MKATSARLAGLAAFSVLALSAACNPDKPVEPGSLKFDAAQVSAAELVQHVVAPQATDPAIDRALDDHYAWLDTIAPTNHRLFVYLPGSGGVPANALLVQQEAARLGYHVIGLMYVSEYFLASLCGGSADPNSCFESAHYEIVYGTDRSPLVEVNVPNSIYSRLTRLLQYLDANYPDEGWSQFLADGNPKWSQIAVGGASQGGGNAAMIAKDHVVDRVVLFSAVTDALGAVDCQAAQNWEATHVTVSGRYWGLAHDSEPAIGSICASWSTLGMDTFGPLVAPEASAPPYGGTHRLVTALRPQRGGYKAAHPSTVIDFYTPLNKDGTPALADAWRYMLSPPLKAE
jgi:hypothetical protein